MQFKIIHLLRKETKANNNFKNLKNMFTSLLATILKTLFPKSFATRQQEFLKKKELIESKYKEKKQ